MDFVVPEEKEAAEDEEEDDWNRDADGEFGLIGEAAGGVVRG